MSIQKKLRAVMIPLAGICCIAPVTEAKADNNTYKVEGAYEVSIPAEVTVNETSKSGTLQITGSLEAYHNVNVSVSSEHQYNLVNTEDNSRKVAYNIQDADKSFTFSNEAKAAKSTDLNKEVKINVSGTPAVSGKYTDTLTFTLTAEDKTPTYTVTFDLNCTDDSAATPVQTKTVKKGSTYGELPTPTRDGYTFQGWYTAQTGGTKITAESGIGAKDITLYARWKENVLTIHYHTGGAEQWNNSSTEKTEILSGEEYVIRTSYFKYSTGYENISNWGLLDATRFVRTGYNTQAYWRIGSSDSETKIAQDNTPFSGDTGADVAQALGVLNQLKKADVTLELYPYYVAANTYTIMFDANASDATGEMESVIHTCGNRKTLTKNSYVRAGYTFSGWNTAADGSGTTYADEKSVTNLTEENGATVTLYAQWRGNVLTVRYHADGAETWTDWRVNDTYVAVTDDVFYKLDSAYHWNYGTAGLIDVGRLKKPGYSTKRLWKIGSANSTKYGETVSDTNDAVGYTVVSAAEALGVLELLKQGDTAVDLYPVYVANTYTVAYDANASDASGTTANSSHTYDTAASLTKNGYTREGYTFTGWNTKAEGTGTAYADGAEVKNLTTANNGTVTLYAQWKADSSSKESASEAKAQNLDLWEEDESETEAVAENSPTVDSETDFSAAPAGEMENPSTENASENTTETGAEEGNTETDTSNSEELPQTETESMESAEASQPETEASDVYTETFQTETEFAEIPQVEAESEPQEAPAE